MKKIVTLCVLMVLAIVKGWAQPTVLYTGLSSTTPSPTNSRFTLNTVGGFKQYRFQSNQTAAANSLGWAFHIGTPSNPDYTYSWRPYTSGNLLSVNTYIPYGNANGARYNNNGGADGLLPAITSGNYYTFNVTNHANPNDNMMELLETSFNPVTISTVSQVPGNGGVLNAPVTVKITTSAAPSSGEYVYVRYSTNGYTTSGLALFTFSGTTGTATIPAQTAGTTVSYYVMSSNQTAAQIASAIASDPNFNANDPQNAYDMSTLNLNNNSGSNYSYTVSTTSNVVSVTSTGGTTGATYATLGAAFTAISAGTHTGVISILIYGNTTETATAQLNASGSGAASYTSMSIQPAGGAARTVTGAIAGNLIYFNGADNVTIDGLNTGGNSLTFSNTNTGTSTTTFYLDNDATSNTIQNCTVLGSNTSNATFGTITFGNATGTGNDNNIINTNNIGAAGSNLPTVAIYSIGGGTTIDNSGIQITNNNIYDYFNAAQSSSGILTNSGLVNGTSAWTITGNRFYQTATRIFTTGLTQTAINIQSGSGYTISNNVIGYANASGTGTTNIVGNSVALTGTFPSSYTATGTANVTKYIAINCSFVAGGTNSLIQGNTVAGFALYSSSGAGTTTGIWCGIAVNSGSATIGGTSSALGNTIGATSGQSSVYVANSGGGGASVGIYATSTNTVSIQYNSIGAFDCVGTTTTLSGAFTGIDVAGTGGIFAISNNTIGNATANNIRVGYTATGGNLSNTGTLTSITGTTSPMVGIRHTATGTTVVINNNTLQGWQNGTTTGGQLTGITSTGAVTTSATINSNALGTSTQGWVNYAFANTYTTSTALGINLSGAGTATAHSIQSNDFRGITFTTSGAMALTFISISGATTANDIATIASNTFTNLSVNTTGSIIFISHSYAIAATGQCIINNNSIVTGFTKGGAGGTNYITYTNSTSTTGSINNYTNNNFSNITLTGATPLVGFNNTDGGSGSAKTITGNTFNSWTGGTSALTIMNFTYFSGTSSLSTNTITNITGQSSVTAINTGSTASGTALTLSGNIINNITSTGTGGSVSGITNTNTSTTININGNTINTLSSTGSASTISAITISGATTYNISKNKIYDLSGNQAGSIVNGINVTSATTLNIANNLIGDLRATAATGLNAINGINASATATYNVYYNTIYLNATSSSTTTFGNSCITFSSTATSFNLRNNILTNLSTPAQNASNVATNGIAASLRRSSGTAGTVPSNYATTSNNNDYYCNPTAGTNNHLSYVEGTSTTITNPQNTVANVKTFMVTRDQSSVQENPAFLSTSGSSANFLHINTATATQLESGGTAIAGYTDDYDGDTRNATTPDIGADEFTGIAADATAPAITYTALGNTACATNRTLSSFATITDASGVNTAAGTRPRLYYKKSTDANTYAGNTSANNGWKYVESSSTSSPFDFTIDYSLLQGGAVATNDIIQYFVVAQDLVTTPNVGINSGIFTTTPASVALTASAFPITGTINSYTIIPGGLSGTVTIGASGTYTSLTGTSGLFNAINTNGLGGNLVVNIVDASVTETGAVALNQITNTGCASGINTVTIKPSTTATLTGSVASNALIKLNGADYVTIDGSNSGGTDKSLTITNTNATAPSAISLISLGTGAGATNNTIKNCNISTAAYAGANYGISISGTTIGAGGADNDNVTVQNNTVTGATIGIYANGTASASAGGNDNLIIAGNTVTVNTTVTTAYGIETGNAVSSSVNANTVSVTTSAGGQPVGISLETGFVSSAVAKNYITTVYTSSSGGFGARGITIGTGTTSSSLTVSNNVIYGVNSASNYSGFSNSSSMGIGIGVLGNGALTNTTGGVNLYYNSINMYGTHSYATNTITAALYVGSAASALDIRDNIFVNSLSNTSTSGTGSKDYGIYSVAAASAYTTLNYNDYYGVSSANSTFVVGSIGSTDQASLTAWQTATGKEANGKNVDPQFASNTNLQPTSGSGVIGGGTPVTGITTDIANVTRSASAPSIGAYETAATVVVINSVSISPTGSQCNTPAARTVTANTTAGSTAITSVVLNYSFNGTAQTAVTMTGGSTTGTSTWTGTIPAAPAGTVVTWSVTATDGLATKTTTGTSYQDAPLTGVAATATASPTSVCTGGASTLTGTFGNATVAATYTAPPAVSSPTTDEDLGTFKITQGATTILSNTTSLNSLVGTIGTATGTAGSYSNFTAFGPYSLTAGQTYTFTATTVDQGNGYSSGVGVYIDYNRNGVFTDAGETIYQSASTTTGPHTESGSFTIPATAFNGLTRIRVLVNESTVPTGPTQSVSYGEWEEYTLNISSSANGGGGSLPTFTSYSWSDGSTVVGTTNPLPVNNLTSTKTYTLTATTASGCQVISNGVTVSVVPPLNGTYTVGATGAYTNLTAAVNAYNNGCVGGPVTFLLQSDYSSAGETFPITINANTNASSVNTLTIKPASGVSPVITGSSATSILKLDGADYVIIDGSNNGTTSKNLSIINTNNTATSGSAVVWLASASASDGATNNTIKNCIITGNASTTTQAAVFSGGTASVSTTGNALAVNSNTVIQNNTVSKAQNGIFVIGVSTTALTSGISIIGNTLGSTTSGDGFSVSGITAQLCTGLSVTGNDIQNLANTGSSGLTDLALQTINVSLYLRNCVSSTVSGNYVHNMNIGGSSVIRNYGISIESPSFVAAATPSQNLVYNNAVYDVRYSGTGSSTWQLSGINDNGGYGDKFYYNTVSLTGAFTTTSGPNAAFSNGNAGNTTPCGAIDVRNNIFYVNVTAAGTSSLFYAHYDKLASASGYTFNYNDLYAVTAAGTPYIGLLGSTNYSTLSTWQTATAQEANSISSDPLFVGSTNPQPTTGSLVIGAATPISGITTDITGASRSGTAPSMGAYENPVLVVVINSLTISPAGNLCTPASRTVTANTTAGGTNIVSVVLNYSYNGVVQSPVTMTGGSVTGTSGWTGTIPAAPAGTVITWSVTATDGITSKTTGGPSYQDAPLTGATATASASPAPICAGSNTTLTGTFVSANANINIGSPTSTTILSATGASPFSQGYEGQHTQYLILASDLTSAGLAAGNLTGLTFYISSKNSTKPYTNYNMKLAATAATSLSGLLSPTFTTVYSGSTTVGTGISTAAGANSFTFSTPFSWNGTSNILLDVCFANDPSGTGGTLWTSNDYVRATTKPYTCTYGIYDDNSAYCGATTGTNTANSTSLPVITFVGPGTLTLSSFVWKDETNATVGTANPLTFAPSVTHTYTVTGTDANGCSITSTGVQVAVNPVPNAPVSTTPANQCGQPTYTVTTSVSNPTFNWYTVSSGGTPIATTTTGSYAYTGYSTGVNTLYVSVSNGTCESPRTQIDVTVTAPAAVTALANGSATPASVCLNSTIVLSTAPSTYTSFTWTASPAAGSGIATSQTGNPLNVVPTASGTYTYTVQATDGLCTANNSVSIIVNALPNTPTVTASATKVCSGGTVTLTASTGASSYCTPTYTTTYASNDYIGNVTFAGINNTTGDASNDYTYYSGQTATVTGGSSYPISLKAGSSSSLDAQQFGVWIDFNQNGTFEASEFVFSTTTSTTSAAPATGTIAIPATAYNGTTRMRVVSQYSTVITSGQACSIPSPYGEAEDYDVAITGGTVNPNTVTYVWKDENNTTVGTNNPLTITVAAAHSYTATATNGNGCSATSAALPITIGQPLAGVYSVGSSNISGEAGHYSTLTAAVADYNSLCQTGAVTFALTNATYDNTTETFPIVINQGNSASATNTLTIKPNTGVTSTITGNSTSATIKLNGADYVTINGSNSGGTDRNLTITNANNGTSSAVVWLASASSSDGATNNVIKNVVITGNASTTTLMGIFSGGTGSVAVGTLAVAANSNNIIQNDSISKAQIGIWVTGTSTTILDNKLLITGNKLGSSTSGDGFTIGAVGIQFQNNAKVTNNDIQNVTNTGSGGLTDAVSQTINFGLYVRNGTNDTLSFNKIHGINIGGSSIIRNYGISIESPLFNVATSASAAVVYNNFVYDVRYSGTGSLVWQMSGINDNGGYNDKFYYNSVSLSGTFTTTGGVNAAFSNGNAGNTTAASVIDVRNNIFHTGITTASSSSAFYAHYTTLTSSTGNTWNYNDLYATTTTGTAYTGYFNSSSQSTLASWKSGSGQDASSVSVQPNFVSATDLHLTNYNNFCLAAGTAISGITTDIDGDTRTIPVMGADEFTFSFGSTTTATATCTSSGVTVTVASPASTLSAGTYTVTYNLTGANSASGQLATMTYTAGTTNSGTFTVAGTLITNAGNTTVTIVSIKPTTACTTTNTAIPVSATTANQATFTVNPAPVVTVSAGTTTCAGTGVNITFTGTPGSTVNYSVSGSQTATGTVNLPTGAGTTSVSISTPVTAGSYTYTLTSVTSASNCPGATGSTATATVAASPTLSAANGSGGLNQTPCKNSAITPISYNIGGSATGATVSGLPSGVTPSVSGSTVTISGTPTVSGSYTFTITTTGGNCTQATVSGTINISAIITWTGANSANWNLATNWCGGTPASTDAVVIPTGLTTYPVLPANITVASLTIQNGATVNINGYALTATTISGSGTISGSVTSDLTVNGVSTLKFTPGANTLHDLTIGGTGTTTLDNVKITGGANSGTVTVNNGAVLAISDSLILKSNAAGTAAIGTNTSGNTYVTGNVTAERFTDAKPSTQSTGGRRAWRIITSPVTGQTIHQAWQENAATNIDPNPGYGTLITGYGFADAPAAAVQGYDWTGSGRSSSIRRYDIVTNSWIDLPSPGTLAPITNEQAYFLFVRGNRTVGLGTNANSTADTLRSTGTLKQGPISVPYNTGTQYILVGNPYASAIDFSKVIGHNSQLQDLFYTWNSTIGTYGAYVTVSHDNFNNTYVATPTAFSNLTLPGVQDQYKYIPSGAGIFVSPNSTATGGYVTFQEGDKSPGKVPPVNPFRVVNTPGNLRQLLVNLNLKDSDTSATLADGFRAMFSPDYEGNEQDNSATKPSNLYENLGLTRDNNNLIIEARGEVKKTDTLYMKLWNTLVRKYQFQVMGDNFASAPGIQAWLEDSYLKTKQELALGGSITTIDFEVNYDSGSWKSDRFRIVFENSGALPVTLTKVNAQPKNGGVEVGWTVTNETNVKGYTIEKSTDGGRTFTSVGQQAAHNNPQAAITSYSGYDAQPRIGDNYYRIRIEAKDGTITYSTVVRVTIGAGGTGIQIALYPNPVREGKANLKLTNLKEGAYLVSVYSGSGQTVFQKKIYITLANTTQTEQLIMGNGLAQGSYQVKLSDSKGNVIFNDQLIVGR